MATFAANPNPENEPWIETAAIEGHVFRIWHLMFFCLAGFTALMVFIFCCIKFRIPRTKQEIEADYKRKKLTEKFRERLKLIQNQDMDAMDLQKAVEIIQDDYKKMTKDIDEQVAINVAGGNFENENLEIKTDPQKPCDSSPRIS